jgi:hypothetical protein
MPTAPSLWSSGVEWATAETEGADAYWVDELPSSGRPHVFVAIEGNLVNGFGDDSVALQSGSWNLGRRDWFDVLTPGTATFTFFGVVDAEAGDEVVVSCEAGVLWVGNVNDRTETQHTAGHFTTTLTATDAVGRLSTAVVPDGKLTVGDDVYIILFLTLDAPSAATDDVIRWLMDTYGAEDVGLAVGDSAGTLPNLTDWYEPPDGLTLLDILNQIERTANAMLALQPDGSLLLTMRDSLPQSDNLVTNDGFETNTTGWAAYLSGAIARSTSSPITGTASGRITSSTTQYSGTTYDLTGITFRAGTTYRFSLSHQLISGSDSWYAQIYGAGSDSNYEDFTASGTAGTVTVYWTPTADRSAAGLWIGCNTTTSSVLAIDDVTVVETVGVVNLANDDAPYEWTKTTSASDIINHWVLERPQYHDADPVLDEADADSVTAYGDRSYSVGNYLCTTATHFTSGLKAAMKEPRAIVTDGRFHIHDLGQQVLFLAPLSWVRQGDDVWQIMSVRHDFSGSSWDMTVTADVSQNAMTGEEEPEEGETPDGVTVDTQTLTSSKSATVAKTSGGTFAGNGAGNNLPVGYYAGFRTRVLIGFSFSWPADFIRVKSAKLNLRTTDQNWVAFGSSPKFYVRRVTESWTEGTFDAAAPNQYSSGNAVVWPGPAKTSSGQVLKSIGASENNDITVDITDIAQGWHDAGGSNFSVMLVSANEDASRNTIEFWSDDHGTSAFRPELVLKCEVEA